jgi:hypothetical protein
MRCAASSREPKSKGFLSLRRPIPAALRSSSTTARKRGSTKTTATFKLERATLELLRARVPRGAMTTFVENALVRALHELDAKTSR